MINSGMRERRRHKRITVNGVYGNVLRTLDNIEIINISLGGAAIRLDRNLVVGKEYSLKLDNKGMRTEIKGIVVWSEQKKSQDNEHKNSSNAYHAGIKFDDVFTSKAAALIDFIELNKPENSKERLRGLRVSIKSPKDVVIYDPLGYKVKLISPFGMLIETTQPINPEDKLSMELLLKDVSPYRANLEKNNEGLTVQNFFQDYKAVRFLGRIVSCTKTKESRPQFYDIGVEFLDMQAKDWADLYSFINSL